jgi:predicted AAA+ superfamily ATPase
LQRAQVELERVGDMERRVGVVVQGVLERRHERAVQLDDVDVRRVLGQVFAKDAETPADLERDVAVAELGRTRDDAEDVRVDEEVLAEVALGAHAELTQPAQARLAREVLGHHPNRVAALASTMRSSSS